MQESIDCNLRFSVPYILCSSFILIQIIPIEISDSCAKQNWEISA